MMAALTASRHGSVTLMERAERLGRKLAVTGNGRCNLTNLNISPSRYHGDAELAMSIISRFDVPATLAFFRDIGLLTVSEPSGRVYPRSDQAGSVVDVLRFAVAGAGIRVETGTEVTGIERTPSGFEVRSSGGVTLADRVIIACGGAAGARVGGGMSGYDVLTSLGHSSTPLYPSLVQLKTENSFTRPLKGVRADAAVAVESGGSVLAESAGEVQFTEYGLSGPAVFEISRAAVMGRSVTLMLDLARDVPEDELVSILLSRRATPLTLENLLTGILHNKLGRTVVSHCGLSLTAPCASLREVDAKRVAGMIKHLSLAVTGNLGFDGAQVTAGGIRTSEFDPETLQSRIVPGLFACGEVLDVDGDCGGYNLQWAWSSGRLAGMLGLSKG